ncbi:HD domain-containing phosphohydrolase [Aeromonas simiae]|uniref:HD domain-containing phosphohydrolase n=1 Tax=Aeromonas simiae TaxID=218936 RepID=UPI0005A650F3|nr:HD domain-containing phosphohydrolase [Aeromonas simiae]
MKRHGSIPFYLHLSYLFIGLLLVFALVSGWYQYRAASHQSLQSAHQHYQTVAQNTARELLHTYQGGQLSAELLAQQGIMTATSLQERLAHLRFFTISLANNPSLVSLYIGYRSGDFFLVRRYQSGTALAHSLAAPSGSAWVVQSMAGAPQRGEFLFFDAELQLLERRSMPDYRYDPRQRYWYQAAIVSHSPVMTAPYAFATNGLLGITLAQRTANGMGVAASDIQLEQFGQLLQRARTTPGSRLALLSDTGQVLATATEGEHKVAHLPTLRELGEGVLLALLQQRESGEPVSFHAPAGTLWEGMRQSIAVQGEPPLTLLMASPHTELLADAMQASRQTWQISLLLLGAGLAVAFWLSRLASRPLNILQEEVRKIEQFKFGEPLAIDTRIVEIERLASAIGSMKESIHHFMELSLALASETRFETLLARVLGELGSQARAEGGILYLCEQELLQEAQRFWQGPPTAAEPHPPIALAGDHLLARLLREERLTCPLEPALRQASFPLLPAYAQPLTLLTLPLRNRDGELLGVLALQLDERRQPISPEWLAFAQALAGSAAVALSTQRLIQEQKQLLESFIQLIAGAIDAKSPYTGGHCQRVPELTKMLAQAACAEQEGPFAHFGLDEEQWEALHIAAWLHDCGKVTTPEYVVDKATKLETLYDRIHEVRMRFEVLKRDAEIACWQGIAEGGHRAALETERDRQWAQLDEEFAFVASCNEGSEYLSPEKRERLQLIAQRTWLRTLSDRIGIAHDELTRKLQSPAMTLPVREPLLADKPEHLIHRSQRERIPEHNPWGFRMPVPELLYHRGELHNLGVQRGTLSEEERFKINEHIIQTIIMLEKLPFPRHLRQVPEIAGGHHEKMDGSGYPRGLTREQMSMPARMMAIADIFEALTSVDRPYKRGKTLSEALRIMAMMRSEQHIDPDLFELFLRKGIYLEYAQRYLRPEQIDEVDIRPYLTQASH